MLAGAKPREHSATAGRIERSEKGGAKTQKKKRRRMAVLPRISRNHAHKPEIWGIRLPFLRGPAGRARSFRVTGKRIL